MEKRGKRWRKKTVHGRKGGEKRRKEIKEKERKLKTKRKKKNKSP